MEWKSHYLLPQQQVLWVPNTTVYMILQKGIPQGTQLFNISNTWKMFHVHQLFDIDLNYPTDDNCPGWVSQLISSSSATRYVLCKSEFSLKNTVLVNVDRLLTTHLHNIQISRPSIHLIQASICNWSCGQGETVTLARDSIRGCVISRWVDHGIVQDRFGQGTQKCDTACVYSLDRLQGLEKFWAGNDMADWIVSRHLFTPTLKVSCPSRVVAVVGS